MTKTDMQRVMRDPDLSMGARMLWWELAQWVSHDLPECFRPQHALCEAVGMSRASLLRRLKELQDAELVKIRKEGYRNTYILDPYGLYKKRHRLAGLEQD